MCQLKSMKDYNHTQWLQPRKRRWSKARRKLKRKPTATNAAPNPSPAPKENEAPPPKRSFSVARFSNPEAVRVPRISGSWRYRWRFSGKLNSRANRTRSRSSNTKMHSVFYQLFASGRQQLLLSAPQRRDLDEQHFAASSLQLLQG